MTKKRGAGPTRRGFREYLTATRRARCVVCNTVPAALREEMRDVVHRQIREARMEDALAWLKAEHGIAITLEQWRSHAHAGHKP